MRAAVLGLGLVGGSVARALAEGGVAVSGWDAEPAALGAAARAGVVEPLDDGFAGLEAAEVVVVAVPVPAAPALLRRIARRVGGARLVTDVGSTQRSAVAAAGAAGIGACFVASHPLAGSHRSGWDASCAGLFRGARVYLSPTPATTPAAMGAADALWARMGARTEPIGAEVHDRLLAWSSHAPQAVSSALAGALAGAGVPREALGPGGRDTTRLSDSPARLWAGIALDNADHLAPALAAVERSLRSLRLRLAAGDVEEVEGWFRTARFPPAAGAG